MPDHPRFPVKLGDGRRLEITVNELRHLLDNNAVEIVANGGHPAIFIALGELYQLRDERGTTAVGFQEHAVASQDREWYERQEEDIQVAYRKGRNDAFHNTIHDLSRLEEDDYEDAAYIRGVKSVPAHRRGESAPRPVADRPQA